MNIKSNITVVIPTHNRPDGLAKSLKSLAEQTLLPTEIIVVDDGSSVAVTNTIFDIFPSSVKCTLLRNEIPKGGNYARNRGIITATSEYIAFLDDDDQFKPEKIHILTKSINENPTTDIFYHPAHIHMLNENVFYYSKPYKFKPTDDVFKLLLVENLIGGTPMVTVRREALVSVGLFDEAMPALQDYELWLRLAAATFSFHLIDKPLTNYEQKTKKNSITKNSDSIFKARHLIDAKYSHLYNTNLKKEISFVRAKADILRALLNDNSRAAFNISLRSFWQQKDWRFLASACLSVLGKKAYFKLYLMSK